jgi:23S rRNA (cytosine1962-C5)-methyltransferase
MQRLAKKNRSFDLILLDPPTFSRSKERGVFQVEKHYPRLLQAALPLLRPQGVLFASTNCAAFQPQEFLTAVRAAIAASARPILRQHYAPQPPDFPISRDEPANLKTIWLQIA